MLCRHDELLSYRGVYADMWHEQQDTGKDDEQSIMTDRNTKSSVKTIPPMMSLSFSNVICSTPTKPTLPGDDETDTAVSQGHRNWVKKPLAQPSVDSNNGSSWTLPRPVKSPTKPVESLVARWKSCNAVFLRSKDISEEEDERPVWPRRIMSVDEDTMDKSKEIIDTYLADIEDTNKQSTRQVEHNISLCGAYGLTLHSSKATSPHQQSNSSSMPCNMTRKFPNQNSADYSYNSADNVFDHISTNNQIARPHNATSAVKMSDHK